MLVGVDLLRFPVFLHEFPPISLSLSTHYGHVGRRSFTSIMVAPTGSASKAISALARRIVRYIDHQEGPRTGRRILWLHIPNNKNLMPPQYFKHL
jgi:hypothetical protein